MEPNIKAKGFIIVEKWSYGAVLPQSLDQIPWLNSFLLISRKFDKYISRKRWKYNRVLGNKKPQKGDILVFHAPLDTCLLLKRCVGTPGHILSVENDVWYCDEKKLKYSKTILYDFIIYENKKELERYFCKNNIFSWSEKIGAIAITKVKLNGDQINQLEKNDLLKNLEPDYIVNQIFSKAIDFKFKIPKKGDTICLNNKNFNFCLEFINKYEQKEIIKRDSNFLIDGVATDKYIIQNDYYFMMGDNRSHSIDSRSFGLIPFQKIIGKVFYTF